ncbi:Lrp/AsnC family transcriptional regulator [Megalodesulfovibrio gigas]|uniref:Putative transcriptional regulator, AsnC family n=1 Tax=Megalodesulfovibrio gigas (strain ATCC 19364 / DSM 1382 / NCIMB 9332 / VKM B-1759) TaxID=1121448 RepID=T2GC62_MEGG1|nr:Lrp/AsnC family transcriptional regulator [Megalodesulfovibrio gigas]AGW13764.1 putative transcriptional regulator, AsnC family [Megalodesulfovibrio gigas DSM 1382 = ATCC 19364]
MAYDLDRIDVQILRLLQENARISNAAIAREVGMAPSAVLERIRKLERRQVILGYTAQLNPAALGRGLTAFTNVRTEEAVGATEAGEELARLPGVQEVHHTAGQDCYLVKLRVADTTALAQLLKQFGAVPTVRDTRTTIVLTTVCESNPLPLPDLEAGEGGRQA